MPDNKWHPFVIVGCVCFGVASILAIATAMHEASYAPLFTASVWGAIACLFTTVTLSEAGCCRQATALGSIIGAICAAIPFFVILT